MFRDFIGRNVEVLVSFSTSTVDGGACPCRYFGTLNDVNENSIRLSLTKIGVGFGAKECNGELMEVNIKYVIYIREIL